MALAAQLGHGLIGGEIVSALCAGPGVLVAAANGGEVVGPVALELRHPFQLGASCAVLDG